MTPRLIAVADRAHAEAVARVLPEAGGRSRLRALVAFGVGCLVVGLVVGTLVWTGALRGGPEDRLGPVAGAEDFRPASVRPGEPCPLAERSSLAELAARAPGRIRMPAAPEASSANLDGAWWCTGTPTLTFGGITVSYESGWNVSDPRRHWTDLVEQWRDGRVTTILGRPGFAQDVSDRGPRGEALVIVDHVLIRVLGDGTLPADRLVAIIDSMDLRHPVPSDS